jgi:uncharacterized OsmC-like protein
MQTIHIKESIERTISQWNDHPEKGRGTITAEAELEQGLRIRAQQSGEHVITTDMSNGVGGDDSGPSPGSVARAALASCDASMVAIRAAQEGIHLTTLRVIVEWDYDARGMLGVDNSIPAGPLGLRVNYRLGANDVSTDQLEAVAEWAEAHSPVGDAFRRELDYETDIEIV